MLFRDLPQSRRNKERKHDRPQPRRSDPPPRTESVSIREPGGADRRTGADVGGEHRCEDQSRSETATGDEEFAAAAHEARSPDPDPDDTDGIDDEEREMQGHQ